MILLASVGSGLRAHAAAYTPRSDDEVLERLAPGVRRTNGRTGRSELAEDPENLRDSIGMAKSYLATARAESDPRYVGYAKAILGPWWDLESPPVEVRVLRAAVRAAGFEWERALADLDAVLAMEPGHLEARDARAEIRLARGDAVAAWSDWEHLKEKLSPLALATCRARCERMTERASVALDALGVAVEAVTGATAEDRHAALRVRVEILRQLGRSDDALRQMEELRRLGRRDVRTLALNADLLLEAGRDEEVIALLKGETGQDGLLVRLLEAWGRRKELSTEEEVRRAALREQLTVRLAGRRKRGDLSVLPDEVRFRLRVEGDVRGAGERAAELWSMRREWDDARLVLEAAGAAGDRALEGAVVEWLRARGMSHVAQGGSGGRGDVRP